MKKKRGFLFYSFFFWKKRKSRNQLEHRAVKPFFYEKRDAFLLFSLKCNWMFFLTTIFESMVTEDGLEPTAYGLWFHCSTNWTIPSFSWLWPRLPECLVHMVRKGFTFRSWKGSGVSLFFQNQERFLLFFLFTFFWNMFGDKGFLCLLFFQKKKDGKENLSLEVLLQVSFQCILLDFVS